VKWNWNRFWIFFSQRRLRRTEGTEDFGFDFGLDFGFFLSQRAQRAQRFLGILILDIEGVRADTESAPTFL